MYQVQLKNRAAVEKKKYPMHLICSTSLRHHRMQCIPCWYARCNLLGIGEITKKL